MAMSTQGTRRLAALAVAAATAGALLLPATTGTASAHTPPSTPAVVTAPHANPHPGYARTVSGQLVKVDTARHATPVHPTVATHPQLDSMGSTIKAHEPAGPAARPVPLASVPQLPGIDVSAYQGNLNWAGIAPNDRLLLREGD